jgi:hypothetical protein
MDRRTTLLVPSLLAAALLAACTEDATTPPAGPERPGPGSIARTICPGGHKPGGSAEGEVYGGIYHNGARTCGTWNVSLTPYAEAQGRLHMASYRANLVADTYWDNMFEWWEPLAGFPCGGSGQTATQYAQNGSPWDEVTHATWTPPPPPSTKEGHCVRPGRYFFLGPSGGFDVDYIQSSGQFALNTGTGVNEAVEVSAYDPNTMGGWQDLVINVDVTTTHPGDSPVLEIQNAASSPYLGTFTNDAAPSGTAADWFRFSVMRSSSGWTIDSRGAALARLYFDGTDLSQATAYYSYIPENIPVLRLHRFPNPPTASKVFTVGLELKTPDELVEDIGTPTVTRTVTINRINPDLAPGLVTAPSAGTKGYPLTVTVEERNLGNSPYAPVEANWTRKLYLSTDQVLSPATDYLIDTDAEANAIAAGATISAQRQPTVPTQVPTGSYYVLASLDANNTIIESNEGNNLGASGQVSIGAPPVACSSFENKNTWQMTDQLYSAACSSQGGDIQYRWQTDAGGAWTAYGTSLTYDFPGYNTVGAHYVTLEVKNVTTGVSTTDLDTITVQNGIVTMTGPTNITVKGTYTYTASTASYWWERILPTLTWSGGIGPQTTWNRTWSAGCYEADVRADATSGGVLKRGRRHIVIAIGTGCQP